MTKTQRVGWIQPLEDSGTSQSKTCDRKRPACPEQSDGGRVRDSEDGEVGEAQIMASLLWVPWQGFGWDVFPKQ